MGNMLIGSMKAAYEEGRKDGERIGQQQIVDASMIFFARIGWNADQVAKYFADVNAILDEYAGAYAVSMEQDVAQAHMDEEISLVVPDCLPWCERYPEVKTLGYDKPVREKKHPALRRKKKS